MDDYAQLSVDAFLDQVADRTPTPGGGGVTGLVGALACALARMVAAYSTGKNTEASVRTAVETAMVRLRRADKILRGLITQDANAYAAMTAAGKAARASGDPALAARYEAAVLAAVAVPMEMAGVVSNLLATMDDLKAVTNRHLLSDLGVAAVLADATAHAARYTVRSNLGELADAARRSELLSSVDRMVQHCTVHRTAIESFVREHLEGVEQPGR